ncbi:MAG: oligosaccharide flippase family protein [Ruminococcus flavefaciens]|nr:oligosaccharide flippase family protein [Ruminococcus flavefaciens]
MANWLPTLKRKFHNIPEPAKASIGFTVCSFLSKAVGIITTPVFTRIMTPSQYGMYTVYLSWSSFITILTTLNLSSSVYTKALLNYHNEKEKTTSSFLGLSTLLAISWLIVYLLLRNIFNSIIGLPTYIMIAMFLQMIFEPAFYFWSADCRYNYKYVPLIAVTLVMVLINPALGILSVYNTTYKAEARILSYVLVSTLIGIFFYIKIMRNGRCLYDRQIWHYALKFNIPLVPHYFAQTALNQADRIMIERMVGREQAAIYSIAYTVSSIISIVITAINNSFSPYVYKKVNAGQTEEIRKNSNYLILLIMAACTAVMLLGPEAVYIVGGNTYLEAKWIIVPVATSVFFMFIYSLFATIEFYFEKTMFMMFGSCACACLNIVLNYFFIKIYGYVAAGYTTLVCYACFTFVHYIYYKVIIIKKNISVIYDIKFICETSLAILTIMFLTLFGYKYSFARYSATLVLFIVFLFKYKAIISYIKGFKQ